MKKFTYVASISILKKKSTGIALVLSLLLPGAGHYYLDRMDVGKYFFRY